MNNIDKAKRSADLLLPKLEHYRNQCGGGLLHEVLQHVALVKNYRDMLENNMTRIPPETLANDLLRITKQAESFLSSILRKIQ